MMCDVGDCEFLKKKKKLGAQSIHKKSRKDFKNFPKKGHYVFSTNQCFLVLGKIQS